MKAFAYLCVRERVLTFDTFENWMTTETTSQSLSVNTLENNTLAYLSVYQNQ